ncbi:hypothetical protein BC739_000422 [Kutzneria viridogrisea]|uniref:ANTAR domain-containing protein n=2 Tax=Kutzneria TaxID=43356 RepID=W5WF69_9PSEU|nr:ANTAR domain-containing protein [Kutzneria albida]AHH99221.1 hypothetical protein KALB_5860 [Kutzneria albida DSM 43870]MBA8923225.1 hypothetical protein [Kutzneria viridogrisea]
MDGQRRAWLWQRVADGADHRSSAGWAGVVCEVAVDEIDVDAVAISVRSGARVQELVTVSEVWAQELEELQYTLGEGPGVEAFTTGGPVLVAEVHTARGRWPGFADAAGAHGLAAAFSFPLQSGAIRLGVLTLYRGRAGPLATGGLMDAAVLAELATAALLADATGSKRERAQWIREDSSGHYDAFNVATGMLAAQLRISIEEASLRLRAHAFSHNRSLLEVAQEVLRRHLSSDLFRE